MFGEYDFRQEMKPYPSQIILLKPFLWGHWYPRFGRLMTFSLGFEAVVDLLTCMLHCLHATAVWYQYLCTSNRVFHQLDENANNGIFIFTACKQKKHVIKYAPSGDRTRASDNLWFFGPICSCLSYWGNCL